MKKLFKLREWVTLSEAASHLTIVLGENVAEHDVLRLALDRHLVLSVIFIEPAYGQIGWHVPLGKTKAYIVGLGSDSQLKVVFTTEYGADTDFPDDIVKGIKSGELQPLGPDVLVPQEATLFGQPDVEFSPTDDSAIVIEFSERYCRLSGIFDLPLVGGERVDIERQYQALTGGVYPTNWSIGMKPAVVESTDDVGTPHFYRLQHYAGDSLDPADVATPWNNPKNFTPQFGLPNNAQLVVRTAELRSFENSMAIDADSTSMDESRSAALEGAVADALSPKGKNTYLVIIAAMAKELKLDISQPSKAANQISAMTDAVGATIGSRAIENKLKEIPGALERRQR